MRNWAHSLILTLGLLAAPAVATPPQVVWITDALFAQNDEVVLVLRTIGDNHGSHFTTQTDTFLLTVDRADGGLRAVAPVERVVDHHLGEPEIDKTTFTPIDGAVNPYAVRAELNAAPLADPVVTDWQLARIAPDSLQVVEGEEVTHRIGFDALRAQLAASVRQTRDLLPVLHGPIPGAEPDPESIDFARECATDAVYARFEMDQTPPAMARMICEDREAGGVSTYWVTVPAVGG
ncbi:hypothetical protein [Thalassorhabdomicrobium marinisediminis]|uniref:DUF4424 domain-containing protein n=1 Tax=Thalassorhabdomicrobium marinisediminis TaxID=2170577 RepID=A0A2T7FZI2_9RHOB|nr:hypothetical protein [Thalassorhabdomicrobium marinisediminis]PVA07573.1 hypothetical protein DC363_02765 [Thalassorhabdomicrobium marinisediminis]